MSAGDGMEMAAGTTVDVAMEVMWQLHTYPLKQRKDKCIPLSSEYGHTIVQCHLMYMI